MILRSSMDMFVREEGSCMFDDSYLVLVLCMWLMHGNR